MSKPFFDFRKFRPWRAKKRPFLALFWPFLQFFGLKNFFRERIFFIFQYDVFGHIYKWKLVWSRSTTSPSTTSTAMFIATFTGGQVSAFTLIWVNQTPERLFCKYQSYSGRSKTLNNWWSLNSIPDQHGDLLRQLAKARTYICKVIYIYNPTDHCDASDNTRDESSLPNSTLLNSFPLLYSTVLCPTQDPFMTAPQTDVMRCTVQQRWFTYNGLQ